MFFKRFFFYALANINKSKRRTILSGVAIMVPAFGICFMISMYSSMLKNMQDNIIKYYNGDFLIENADYVKYKKFNPTHLVIKNSSEIIEKIKNNISDIEIDSRIDIPATIKIKDKFKPSNGIGYTENSFLDLKNNIIEGNYFSKEKQLIISSGLSKKYDLKIGQRLTVMTQTMQRSTNLISFDIIAIAKIPEPSINANTFFLRLEDAKKLRSMDEDDALSSILIVSKKNIKNELENLLKDYNVNVKDKNENLLYLIIKIGGSIYYIVYVFFLFLGASVLMNTMMMIIIERKKEIGALMYIGMHKKEIIRIFLIESGVISLIFNFLGIFCFYLLASFLNAKYGGLNLEMLKDFDFMMSGVIHLNMSYKTYLIVYIVFNIVVLFASYLPLRSILKLEILEALKND